MSNQSTFDFDVAVLDRDTAHRHAVTLAQLLSRIPKVIYTAEDIIAESKRGSPLDGKWQYSLLAQTGGEIVGVLLTYIRPPDFPLYPFTTFYLAGLAVAPRYERRGIATMLLRRWVNDTEQSSLMRCGQVQGHSAQTNSAAINQGVRRLYESLGFEPHTTKQYDNRTDIVLLRGSNTSRAEKPRLEP